MQRQTINEKHISCLSWAGDNLIDWMAAGKEFFPNSQIKVKGVYYFTFPFDRAITFEDGIYAVIYQNLGTKGLLLKNGKILREINRSFYQAEVYEYPIAFAKLIDGRTILIHCPEEYCRIDFEDVETGERLTSHPDRNPSDFFHSRFEVSQDNQNLLSKGWAWHPMDLVECFNITDCIENPLLLDKPKFSPDVDAEICTASFITNNLVLIGSPKQAEPFNHNPSNKLKSGQIGIWNLTTNIISNIIQPAIPIGGHLIAIDDTFAWELLGHPKIINYKTGEMVDEIKDINSGSQISSIVHHLEKEPIIAVNRTSKQVAICNENGIDILSR
jgi:hypothetical protein